MNLRNFLRTALLGTLVAVALPASAAQVSFSFTGSGIPWGYGSFAGTDANNDHLLTLTELTSFSSDLPEESIFGLALGDLSGFGSFNLTTGVWNADGPGWGIPNFAWYAWNGDNNSVNPQWATMTITRFVPDNNVPEPASLALLGLALAGMGAARRRTA